MIRRYTYQGMVGTVVSTTICSGCPGGGHRSWAPKVQKKRGLLYE